MPPKPPGEGVGRAIPMSDVARKRRRLVSFSTGGPAELRRQAADEPVRPRRPRCLRHLRLRRRSGRGVTLACAREDEASIYEGAPRSDVWERLPEVRPPGDRARWRRPSTTRSAGPSRTWPGGCRGRAPAGSKGSTHFGPFEEPLGWAGSPAAALRCRSGPGPGSTSPPRPSHPLVSVCPGAAAARLAVTVEGGVVQGLRSGVPAVGHRPAAGATLSACRQGHAGSPRPRAADVGGGARPDARSRRPWTSWPGRCPRCSTGLSTATWHSDGEEREEFVRRRRAARPQLLRPGGPRRRCGCSAPSYGCRSRSARSPCRASSTGSSSTQTGSWSSPTTRPAGRRRSSREQSRLGGVHFYAFLCEQVLGRRPARVQLLHLREPLAISTVPSDQSIRVSASRHWPSGAQSSRRALREDFRPKPGWLCDHCAYHEYCPAVGGDLTRVPVRTPAVVEGVLAAPPLRAAGGSARPAPSAVAAVGP